MTVQEAAKRILEEAGEPLHYREITKRILDSKLWETDGQTPWESLNARLSMDIKTQGEHSEFVRVAPGIFALNPAKPHSRKARKKRRSKSGSNESSVVVPQFHEYMNPILLVLRELGGSASNEELSDKVTSAMALTDDQLALMHGKGTNMSEVDYRIAWAKTYLKKAGILENSARGVWALSPQGVDTAEVDPQSVIQNVRTIYRKKAEESEESISEVVTSDEEEDTPESDGWKAELLETLIDLTPDAFERLSQRILRESGFIEVKVTGRSGDRGIDGVGLLRIQDIVSFHVFFQCKKYQGAVGPGAVRDFRGAMVGRTDKGIFITTGTFTKEARREATRDGAPPIDLIDGDHLLEMLKKLGLGVKTEIVEQVTVDRKWFDSI